LRVYCRVEKGVLKVWLIPLGYQDCEWRRPLRLGEEEGERLMEILGWWGKRLQEERFYERGIYPSLKAAGKQKGGFL